MKKILKIGTIIVLFIVSSMSMAGIMTYTDRAQFNSASNTGLITENLESFSSSSSHIYSPNFNFVGFDMSSIHTYHDENSTGGGSNPFNSDSSNDYFWLYNNEPVTFTLTQASNFFGLDVGSVTSTGKTVSLSHVQSPASITTTFSPNTAGFMGFSNSEQFSVGTTFILSISSGDNYAGFDNVSIGGSIATVPESSTLAIFVLGMIGLVSRRFKKQS